MTRKDAKLAIGLLTIACLAAIDLRNHHSEVSNLAYIGPGAGFAFLGSFLSLLLAIFAGIASLALWPFRALWLFIRRKRSGLKPQVRKIIFLGLDGLDPGLTERFLSEGKLPNLQRLQQQGGYRRLRTTFPPLSPVAWSTFATGVNPAKHNIFDFLDRDLRNYAPRLASATVEEPHRYLRIGSFRFPLSKPTIESHRKSEPFWKILGKHSITSTILRVPITFPPDEFPGRLLSAMATPDLRGTQGTFSWFSTEETSSRCEGGNRYPLQVVPGGFAGSLTGPDNTFVEGRGPASLPFRIDPDGGGWRLEIDGQRHPLQPGIYSPWVRVQFSLAPGIHARGIVRFLLTETSPHLSLYATPVQIDPESPALPISHPRYYAMYLAKLIGTYSTLGMAEDTWALNEGAIDHDQFLSQAKLIQKEREAMFFHALERTRRGVVACVFDTTDRVQHMFFRHLGEDSGRGQVIEDLYRDMDRVVGETMRFADESTALFVLSDHGFCSFRRGVNLNAWLRDNGYLTLLDGRTESGEYFEGIDWSRTRAYTFGLGGLFLNLSGREAEGIVSPADAPALRLELVGKLSGLKDHERDAVAIRQVYESEEIYRGPYLSGAPDLIVGYAAGYRASWEAAVGHATAAVFSDNDKAWSGDHCVDPALVPGVLFANRPLVGDHPGIEDLAPTALSLFGVPSPRWMEGTPLIHRA